MDVKIKLLIVFSLWFDFSIAQIHETNPDLLRVKHWVLGDSLGIIFNRDSYTPFKSNLKIEEGCAILSSVEGSVIIYTDGINVFDSSGTKINNSSLKGYNSSIQSAVILNLLDDSIIAVISSNPTEGYFYSEYGFNSNNWSEKLVNKKILKNASEAQTSISHQNQISKWYCGHQTKNNRFYFFYFGENGMVECPVSVAAGGSITREFAQIKFSPSGNVAVLSSLYENRIQFFRFNDEDGLLEYQTKIDYSQPFSIEFSPNEEFLYITGRGTSVDQVKVSVLLEDSINQSRKNLFSTQEQVFGCIQLFDDGVAVTVAQSHYLATISNPNSVSQYGDIKFNTIYLDSNRSANYGLPNFNASYFYTPSIDFAYTEDCWSHAYQFEGRDTFEADGYKWIFQKNNQRDSILTKHCHYQFPDTGKWKVSHIAWNAFRADTVTKTLTLYPKWIEDPLGKDTFYCEGKPPHFVLKAPPQMHCIHWNGEEPNLDEELGPIIDYNNFHIDSLAVDTAGTYVVKLTNKTFCQIYDTLVVEEKARPSKPVISFNTGELASTVVADQYDWYLNDTFYLSTSERSIIPSKSGKYQLVLTSAFGCKSEMSDSFILSLGISDKFPPFETFTIYPNPGDGFFNIKSELKEYALEIYDATGRKLHEERNCLSFKLEIPGNYLLVVKTKGEKFNRVITVR